MRVLTKHSLFLHAQSSHLAGLNRLEVRNLALLNLIEVLFTGTRAAHTFSLPKDFSGHRE